MPCTICLESKRWFHETRKLKCNHNFHMHCIQKWSHINKTCPICRIKILPQKPVNTFFLYNSYKGKTNKSPEDILYEAGIEENINDIKKEHSILE